MIRCLDQPKEIVAINLFSFQGEDFLGVCLEWGVEKTRCFVINIYSKCDLVSKRRLWEYLSEARRSRVRGLTVLSETLMWCVGAMRGGGYMMKLLRLNYY